VIEQHSHWAQDLTQERGRGYKYLSHMQREISTKRSKVRARVEHAIEAINASSALPGSALPSNYVHSLRR